MHRTCDLLEVPLGGGAECSHRTHILVYISDGAIPSRLHAPYSPSPSPSGPCTPPGRLENRHGPLYSISEQPFSPISQNPPGRVGEGSEGVLLVILHLGRLAVMEEFCPCPKEIPSEQWSSGETGKFPLHVSQWMKCGPHLQAHLHFPGRRPTGSLSLFMHLANFPVSCTVLGPELGVDLDVNCPQ